MSNISSKRAAALDMAFMASRLLDEKYFDDCAKAVQTNNRDLFMKTCEAAQIPTDDAQNIWNLVSTEPKSIGTW